MIESENVDFDDPGARRHAVKVKRAGVVGERQQDALALRRLDGGSWNRLAFGFDHPGLGHARRGEHSARHKKIAQNTNKPSLL